jgi:hypothetical protein
VHLQEVVAEAGDRDRQLQKFEADSKRLIPTRMRPGPPRRRRPAAVAAGAPSLSR